MHVTISDLPEELLDKIFGHAPKKVQLELCLVSRLFNSIATHQVYQSLHLQTWTQALGCFRTLSLNLTVAQSVRFVLIQVKPQHTRLHALAYNVVSRALENISPLVVGLNFLGFKIDEFPLPAHCPHLRNLSISFSLSANINSFLAHHTKLEKLMLLGPTTRFTLPTIHFPSMSFLVCSSSVAASLVPGSQLSQVGIKWDPNTTEEDLEALFKSLRQTTVPLLSFTSCYWTPHANMFPLVSQHMCDLEFLCFNDIQPSTAEEEIFYEGTDTMLPNLKKLSSIMITHDSPPEFTTALMDNESETITRWGYLCPSLEICHMPSRLEWHRLKGVKSAWIPTPGTDAIDSATCAVWMLNKIRSSDASNPINVALGHIFKDFSSYMDARRFESLGTLCLL